MSKPDNTQAAHMANSGKSPSYALGDAQAELDDILAKHNGELGITWEDPDVVTPDTKQALLDWHNKQVEAVLDRLESMAAYDPSGSSPVINPRQIEAERNKLNNSDGDVK